MSHRGIGTPCPMASWAWSRFFSRMIKPIVIPSPVGDFLIKREHMLGPRRYSESEEIKKSSGPLMTFLKVSTDSPKPLHLEGVYKLKILLGIKLGLLKDVDRWCHLQISHFTCRNSFPHNQNSYKETGPRWPLGDQVNPGGSWDRPTANSPTHTLLTISPLLWRPAYLPEAKPRLSVMGLSWGCRSHIRYACEFRFCLQQPWPMTAECSGLWQGWYWMCFAPFFRVLCGLMCQSPLWRRPLIIHASLPACSPLCQPQCSFLFCPNKLVALKSCLGSGSGGIQAKMFIDIWYLHTCMCTFLRKEFVVFPRL